MKKIFKLNSLDCANCASKIEENIKKLKGVVSVSVSFMAQKMTLETEDNVFDKIVEESKKIIKKIDSDTNLVVN